MTLTRANVESIVVQRAGPLMAMAGMAVTVVGTNASLNDAIGWALRQAGYTVADPSLVTDSDVSAVSTASLDLFLDLTEYRTLLSIMTNLTLVDTKVGPRDEKLSQLAGQIEKRLGWLSVILGFSVNTLTEGVLPYDFAEHGGDGLTEE